MNRGAALVIILSFIVLLMVVLMAYFSQSLLERQISNSSSNLPLGDNFAEGALNTVIGDLRQEIADTNRSTATNVVTGSVTTTLYYPKAATNAVPALAGSTGTNGLENLVKRSSSSNAFYPAATNRAAASSTTNASANGRYISAARWNKPLFIQPTATNDLTPVSTAGFVPPDWIYVTRNGLNTNAVSTDVVGRYAYAIYDEGGLLDANVACYPQGSPTVDTASAYKSALSYADLKQAGLSTNNITALVDWRNKATVSASPTNYIGYVATITNGFLKTGTNYAGGTTDRQFVNRQQLIDFFNRRLGATNNPTLQNALQYITHFSRGLEQPSYAPDPNRPRIVHPDGDNDNVSGTAVNPNITNLLNNYRGGNDAYLDSDPTRGDINPAFLDIRVTGTFTRMDGSTAQIGEPLVKKRFPLSRLAWITHDGTPPAGVTAAMIKDAFGLTWCPTMKRWAYDHGFPIANHSTSSVQIGRLKEVRDQNREPDFFELLKATLNDGSLGKAAAMGNAKLWTDTLGAGSYYQMRDKSLECQIYQIGVNLIDQADSDSYPTALWVNNPNRSDPVCTSNTYDGSTFNGTKFFGVEDLPYFHRMFFKAVADLDDPPIPNAGGAPVDYGSDPSSIADTKFYPGTTVLLGQPELWNPHDSTTWSRSTLRPTDFRISAVSEDPDGIISFGSTSWNDFSLGSRFQIPADTFYLTSSTSNSTGGNYKVPGNGANMLPLPLRYLPSDASGTSIGGGFLPGATLWQGYGYYATTWPDNNSPAMTTGSNVASVSYGTELLFNCSSSSLFREPTLLGIDGQPTGSNFKAGPNNRLKQLRQGLYNNKQTITGTYQGYVRDANGNNVGFVLARKPTRWILATPTVATGNLTYNYQVFTGNYLAPNEPMFTIRLEYSTNGPNGPWLTYAEHFVDPGRDGYNNCTTLGDVYPFRYPAGGPSIAGATTQNNGAFFDYSNSAGVLPSGYSSARYNSYDPRGNRFGYPMSPSYNSRYKQFVSSTLFPSPVPSSTGNGPTNRPDNTLLYNAMAGIPASSTTNGTLTTGPSIGWFNINTAPGSNAFTQPGLRMGWLVENNPAAPKINGEDPQYYADPDDVVRRASGAFAWDSSYGPNLEGIGTAGAASKSRPIILNRPFRSVAEMAYAFRGSPWKNIDFSAPETGDAALLDVFCVNEPPPSGLVAGKFNLNTRQQPVLKAILAGAIKSELDGSSIPSSDLDTIANAVLARTSGTNAWEGPLTNISELAGKLLGKGVSGIPSSDSSIYSYTIPSGRTFGTATTDYAGKWSYTSLGAVMAKAISDIPSRKIQPFREACLRGMADTGQCRVWNLMIDVIAQTGRYPQGTTDLNKFMVEGEKRYWLHVAIDRLTGQVLDSQLEAVTE